MLQEVAPAGKVSVEALALNERTRPLSRRNNRKITRLLMPALKMPEITPWHGHGPGGRPEYGNRKPSGEKAGLILLIQRKGLSRPAEQVGRVDPEKVSTWRPSRCFTAYDAVGGGRDGT